MECCIVCCWYFYNSINNYPTDLPGREITAAALMITKHKTGNILNLTKTNIGRASPSSWTKMLALNFLISVREWSGIMRAFLIWSDDQWDDSPEERKNSLTAPVFAFRQTRLGRVVWHKFVSRVQAVTGWVELCWVLPVLSALSSSIDCGIAGWQKPTKTNRILV